MLSIVRRSALAGTLAMSLAVATVGFAPPSAAATPPYGLPRLIQIPKFSTRTVNVCSLKWPGRP